MPLPHSYPFTDWPLTSQNTWTGRNTINSGLPTRNEYCRRSMWRGKSKPRMNCNEWQLLTERYQHSFVFITMYPKITHGWYSFHYINGKWMWRQSEISCVIIGDLFSVCPQAFPPYEPSQDSDAIAEMPAMVYKACIQNGLTAWRNHCGHIHQDQQGLPPHLFFINIVNILPSWPAF